MKLSFIPSQFSAEFSASSWPLPPLPLSSATDLTGNLNLERGPPLLSVNYTQGFACQLGHLHSTQAASFATPWGRPFQGIPHPRLEAKQGCVLALSHSTGEWHLKKPPFPEKSLSYFSSTGKLTCFEAFFFRECQDQNTEARNGNTLFNSCFFPLGEFIQSYKSSRGCFIPIFWSCPLCPSPEGQQRQLVNITGCVRVRRTGLCVATVPHSNTIRAEVEFQSLMCEVWMISVIILCTLGICMKS